jgi:hypothetical protein
MWLGWEGQGIHTEFWSETPFEKSILKTETTRFICRKIGWETSRWMELTQICVHCRTSVLAASHLWGATTAVSGDTPTVTAQSRTERSGRHVWISGILLTVIKLPEHATDHLCPSLTWVTEFTESELLHLYSTLPKNCDTFIFTLPAVFWRCVQSGRVWKLRNSGMLRRVDW